MDEFDSLSPALHFNPTRKEIVRIVRGLPLEDKIFRLTVRNLRPHPVVPVFIHSESFLAIGPLGVAVDPAPMLMEDGREQWRSLEPLGPRETRDYFAFLDTESEAFPPAGSRFFQITLDLFVEEHGYLTPAGNVPIVLREVLDTIPEFTGIVCLDFGTTNTCAVISPHDQFNPRVVVLSESAVASGEEIPSLIAYHDVSDPAAPRYAVGHEAKLLLGQPGGDEVISSVKRYVASGTKIFVGAARDATPVYYRPSDIAGHIVSTVRDRIERYLEQQAVVELTCTYPTSYSRSQIQDLAAVFHRVQSDISERYGEDVQAVRMLVDESTAAAMFYLHHRFGDMKELRNHITGDEFSVLCYDLGGGTTDMSLTRFSFEGPSRKRARPAPSTSADDPPLMEFGAAEGYAVPALHESDPVGPKRDVIRGKIAQRDGLDQFGGDNMTLSVFRILKIRYALLLCDMILSDDLDSMTLDGVSGLRAAADEIAASRKILERWTRRGTPEPADGGVGYPGYAGVEVPEDLWNAIDVLVPTRWHESYDHTGRERDARHDIFYDLWQTAENAKIEFGTPDARGQYPATAEPIPPATLLDRYQIGPARLAARITATELRTHVEPALMLSFAKAKTMLKEEKLLSADFFVLAGNACKLPLIRELFIMQFAALGATEGWNVLFDPAVAKTAVARGAALYAVQTSSAAGESAWTLEEEEDVLLDHIGVLESQSIFASASEPMHTWFARGSGFPGHHRLRVRKDLPSLRVYSTRRLGSPPRWIGAFMFLRESGRVGWHALPPDLEEAVNHLHLDQGGTIREDGTYIADIILTRKQRIFLQRDGMWYALWPFRPGLPDRLNPFSGKQ